MVSYTKISPNKTSPRNHVIDTITIHCVVGQCSVETLGNVFAKTSKQASSNYGIGYDGRIGMYVEEKDRSWCSSNSANDNRAITIEVASDTTHPYAVKDAALTSLIELVADICKRNNIKELKWKGDKSLIGQVDKQNMTVHRWFSSKSCPGDYLYNKHPYIVEQVNKKLGISETNTPATVTPSSTSSTKFKEGDVVKVVGATYYNGKTVPDFVTSNTWIVHSVSGDRVVINKSSDGKYSIMSPFKPNALLLISASASKPANSTTTTTKPATNTSGAGKYASKVVEQAKAWLGLKESDGGHKQIIDIYNSQKPLPVGYKVKYTDAWCATFVSAVAVKLGYTDIIPCECSCPRMITLCRKMGIWVENENRIPNIGDIIFYDWDDKSDYATADNTSSPEHVGIVEKVSNGYITVIEGNYSNSVKRRTISVNGRYIRGYAVPKYTTEAGINTSTNTNTNTSTNITTSKIDTVKEVQNWANKNYKSNLLVDGIYGSVTKKALVKILQTEINKTYNKKLIVDGIFGAQTKAACPMLKVGVQNNVVGVLQALLVCNGYNSAYIDNVYGSATVSAVKTYQRKKGLLVDGIAGGATFNRLCR